METRVYRGHVLVLPYPAQGHINPMLQFCKRLASKGLKTTLAITTYISNTNPTFITTPQSSTAVHFDTISDGFDEGGFASAESISTYLTCFEAAGSTTLAQLIQKHARSAHPINCVVYDAFMPWALDVAKKHGAMGAVFFTQSCAVNCIYYYTNRGLLTQPVASTPVEIPGLPLLEFEDLPGYFADPLSYPAYFEMVVNQLSNVDKANFVLVNTYYELEAEVVDSMEKVCPMLPIGPTIPSFYLDNQVEDDKSYGLSLLDPSPCTNWLSTKPPGSVVYVSFGSMASLQDHQMKELAWALKDSNCYFLWVIRALEDEVTLPHNFVQETQEKALFVPWSSQLEVLSSEAVGCFISHCGWNSTLEALSLGVPVVAMPLWTDQTTNAKFIQDVWRVGVKVKANDKGVMTREEIKASIMRVMEREEGKEMKANAKQWSNFAKGAVSKAGSSDKNIDKFISKFTSF
ncbi:hypothetical protein Ancab_010380 [Ancistrocladus abbreviatus]